MLTIIQGLRNMWWLNRRTQAASFFRKLPPPRSPFPRPSNGSPYDAFILAGAIFFLFPGVFQAAAQQANPGAGPQGPIRASSSLVLVRVVVRDPSGKAVPGLGAHDFRLFDETFDARNPQAIASFTVEQAKPTPVGTGGIASGAVTPSLSPSSPPANLAAARHVALYFDDLHLQTDELARARKAAKQYIAESLQSGDSVAIFDSSGKGMLDFTADRAKLSDALQALRPRPAANLGTSSCPAFDEYQAEMVLNSAQGEGHAMDFATGEILHCYYNDDPNMMMQAKLYVTARANSMVSLNQKQDEAQLAQLGEMVSGMAGFPGPRGIVLISPGFIANGVVSQLSSLIDAALRSGVIISALDARGLYTAASLADVSDSDNGAADWNLIHETAAHANSAVMADLADGTGGVFFQNSNDFDRGFRVTGNLGETAYILAFSPSERQLDGRYHTLKVMVTMPGKFTVQARHGYFAEKNPLLSARDSAAGSAPATPPSATVTAPSQPAEPVPTVPMPASSSPVSPACAAPCLASQTPSPTTASATNSPTSGDPRRRGSPQKKTTSTLWNPPNVDKPLVGLSTPPPCPLTEVLKQAAWNAKEMVINLQKFSARETMQAEMLNELGGAAALETRDYDYLVFISRGTNDLLGVRENHTATYGSGTFDRSMTDSGLTVLALIFYPPYAAGYDMRCEGQVQYQGHTAWVVHFQQRKDKPSITRSFATTTGHYTAALKGRAWIAADTFQVLHLETNLVNWVAGLHLKSEAISIDYGPVQFHIRPVTLWLPQSAEVFSEFVPYSTGSSLTYAENPLNPRYHARYTFTDFKLFSVGTGPN
jgi:VWFA-related protein